MPPERTAGRLVLLRGLCALDLLEESYGRKEPGFAYIAVEPVFGPLHAEPRFQALRWKIGM